jgi:hypothetical protein
MLNKNINYLQIRSQFDDSLQLKILLANGASFSKALFCNQCYGVKNWAMLGMVVQDTRKKCLENHTNWNRLCDYKWKLNALGVSAMIRE